MNIRITLAIAASLLTVAVHVHLVAQTRSPGAQTSGNGTWLERTSWGHPDLQGEWTSEGEFGVPFERPPQFATRQFLTDEEYAARLEGVRRRDERDLARVDVGSGKVDDPNVPIPHWREYNTNSRRTSLVIDPPDGRLPPRTPQARPVPVQRCGSLQRGEPCDTYEDYSLHQRCIVQGDGFPDTMFPAVYNANFRIVQSPGHVAITYELIHDTRVIPIDASPQPDPLLSPAIRMYMGASRGRWEGTTLVVETSESQSEHARLVTRAPVDRAVHPRRAGLDSVRGHVHRSGNLDEAVDRGARSQGQTGWSRRVRLRVPRGELRLAQHAIHIASPRANGKRHRVA